MDTVPVSITPQLRMSWFTWQKPQQQWRSTELWFEALQLEVFPWLCCAQALPLLMQREEINPAHPQQQ